MRISELLSLVYFSVCEKESLRCNMYFSGLDISQKLQVYFFKKKDLVLESFKLFDAKVEHEISGSTL